MQTLFWSYYGDLQLADSAGQRQHTAIGLCTDRPTKNVFYVGRLPTELGLLSNLRNLSLHVNRLSGQLPRELGRLTSVSKLFLWGNCFNGRLPPTMRNMCVRDGVQFSSIVTAVAVEGWRCFDVEVWFGFCISMIERRYQ